MKLCKCILFQSIYKPEKFIGYAITFMKYILIISINYVVLNRIIDIKNTNSILINFMCLYLMLNSIFYFAGFSISESLEIENIGSWLSRSKISLAFYSFIYVVYFLYFSSKKNVLSIHL